jgi:hypothetical protein
LEQKLVRAEIDGDDPLGTPEVFLRENPGTPGKTRDAKKEYGNQKYNPT